MASPRLRRSDVEDMFTLTPLQQGMLSYAADGFHAFRERTVTSLSGPLNIHAFSHAWHAVVRRHPALRIGFVWRDVAIPHQIVFRRAGLQMRHVDWSRLSPEVQERQLQRLLACRTDYTLDRAPLMTLFLTRSGERRFEMVWTISHLITDAFSFSIVVGDLLERYRLALDGSPWDTRPAPSFREYVAWLKRQDLSTARSAWEREIRRSRRPAPPALALVVRGRSRVATRELVMKSDVAAAIRRFSSRQRISMFAVYLGALATVQSVLKTSRPPVIAVITSCRSLPVQGLDSIVGLVMSCVPVPIAPHEHGPWAAWLSRLEEDVRRALRFEHVPFQDLHEVCTKYGLRADVAFNYLTVNRRPLRGPGFDVTGYRQILSSSFPVGVNVMPGSATRIQVSYDTAAFSSSVIGGMLDQWQELLGAIPRGPRFRDLERTPGTAPAAVRALAVEQRRRKILPDWMT